MTSQSAAIRTAAQIRREFIDYFVARHGHTFVPSSPVVPRDDPTLLFTNAGMNQFKDVLLGHGRRDYRRAVNSQKCIRAGGKHNDLEDVGKDHYHHTFFEMLGNWSFGDYFKAEAIEWAWDLLTRVWGLDESRLYVTVFAGEEREGLDPDTEAEGIWKQYVDPSRISRWAKKDNFWEMGEIGPCGPCSEIHYDFTHDQSGRDLVNAGHPGVVELWNLVFIQFNRTEHGTLEPLPARHVDTGMGLERLTRVLQHKDSTYDIDLFEPVLEAIHAHTGAHPYRGSLDDPVDIAYRVIADHIRCLTIAITDEARPGNEGRGYVLRRILRRAVRHGHQTLGVKVPLLCDLVPAVVESLGGAFGELTKDPRQVAKIIRDEEESFLHTLDRGIDLFEAAARDAAEGRIRAEDAFKLHDTYGFPIDLTRVMALERGMTVDEPGYEKLMEKARWRSREGARPKGAVAFGPEAFSELTATGAAPTVDDPKYAGEPLDAKVVAIWNGGAYEKSAGPDQRVAVILDRTNHYAEAGGQVGDHGELRSAGSPARLEVLDTRAFGGYVLHLGRVHEAALRVGDRTRVGVDQDRRRPTCANHTGTHLLNLALREVLGPQVGQTGSLVAPDRLRFDFSYGHALRDAQIEQVESLVNAAVDQKLVVHAHPVPLPQARTINGVRAVFGEKYPDPVRVVSVGAPLDDVLDDPENARWREFSIEFCGGTHLEQTGEARRFVIVHEQAAAAGLRRITAVTGAAAAAAEAAAAALAARVDRAAQLDGAQLLGELDAVTRQLEEDTIGAVARHRLVGMLKPVEQRAREIRKRTDAASRETVVQAARRLAENDPGPIIVGELPGGDLDTLRAAMDVVRARRPDAAAMLFAANDDRSKVAIVAGVPPELIARGLEAGQWIRQAATICEGSGGGRPDRAQAGGKNPTKVADALADARAYAEQTLK